MWVGENNHDNLDIQTTSDTFLIKILKSLKLIAAIFSNELFVCDFFI